jgi:hypothetical protein
MTAFPATWREAAAALQWRESMPLAEAARMVERYKSWCRECNATRSCGLCGRELFVPAELAASIGKRYGREAEDVAAMTRQLDLLAFAFLHYDTDSCEPDGARLCHWCAWSRDDD